MRTMLSILIGCITILSFGQNPEGFDAMCNENMQGTVPTASAEQLRSDISKKSPVVILDSRERKEYNVSHISNAVYVGYDQFNVNILNGVDKNTKIYVYCSVGYRSEKIGEKLINAGYTNVFNLYGGLFNWCNNGMPMVDENGNQTTRIHGYDKSWAQWLNRSKCKPVLK
ncbi:MAG: rhodanese-like domain-containing protein [Crocinitomicaceae bacterium]|nr:rhodanese-like domain-containing protein [Crocinitomicaceae bacterium]